jgi:predicted DNA-binding transcriptional regulator AlpA
MDGQLQSGSFAELLTPAEVCRALRIGRATLRRLQMGTSGFPRPIEIAPRTIRYRQTEISQWIAIHSQR